MAHVGRVLIILGTRPEFVKLAPVASALKIKGARVTICLTGQHVELARPFARAFPIRAKYELGVMHSGQSLARLTARLLVRLDEVLTAERPDVIVVQGDTTSAMAAALAAFYRRITVAHVEAGLRSGRLDQPFPEELNRHIVSRVTSLHYAPTATAAAHLIAAGVTPANIVVAGNTVIDAVRAVPAPRSRRRSTDDGRVILVTAHRRENLGSPMSEICQAVAAIVRKHTDVRVVWPLHANPAVERAVRAELSGVPRISLTGPMNYDDFIQALSRSYLVLSDSGGVQEEVTALGKPVLILREVTERPEVLAAGNGMLVGTAKNRIVRAANRLLTDPREYRRRSKISSVFGDGRAGPRIASDLIRRISAQRRNRVPLGDNQPRLKVVNERLE